MDMEPVTGLSVGIAICTAVWAVVEKLVTARKIDQFRAELKQSEILFSGYHKQRMASLLTVYRACIKLKVISKAAIGRIEIKQIKNLDRETEWIIAAKAAILAIEEYKLFAESEEKNLMGIVLTKASTLFNDMHITAEMIKAYHIDADGDMEIDDYDRMVELSDQKKVKSYKEILERMVRTIEQLEELFSESFETYNKAA